MPSANLKAHLQLNLIVFIWGFTAILGELITLTDVNLVWYRMGLAGIFLSLYAKWAGLPLVLPLKEAGKLILVGGLIAVHWIFFFKAIDMANVSITLAMFSLGAFFGSILEPIFFNRRMLWYEVFFGLVIIAGLYVMMQVEMEHFWGAVAALFSVFIGVLFTLFNGKLTRDHDAVVITTYEFFAGFFFVTLYLLANGEMDSAFFNVSATDWMYLLILASVCTAYAFTASVGVMRKLTPYTVMLTTNLEPVYGILLAYFIIGESERMSMSFYIGAAVILLTVIANGILKKRMSSESPDSQIQP